MTQRRMVVCPYCLKEHEVLEKEETVTDSDKEFEKEAEAVGATDSEQA